MHQMHCLKNQVSKATNTCNKFLSLIKIKQGHIPASLFYHCSIVNELAARS